MNFHLINLLTDISGLKRSSKTAMAAREPDPAIRKTQKHQTQSHIHWDPGTWVSDASEMDTNTEMETQIFVSHESQLLSTIFQSCPDWQVLYIRYWVSERDGVMIFMEKLLQSMWQCDWPPPTPIEFMHNETKKVILCMYRQRCVPKLWTLISQTEDGDIFITYI